MKILYYSNAFIAHHGGKLHSEAFLREASLHSAVSKMIPYPAPNNKTAKSNLRENSGNDGFKRKLKNSSILQSFFFYRRNYNSYKEIVKVLSSISETIDVLHIRVDSNFLIIPKLKKKFPNLVITTEVNASPFDENFKNIAYRNYFKNTEKACLKRADANFFVSEYLKDKIMVKPDNSRDYVVHNGVALESFPTKEKDRKRSSKTIFGYVGTIDYHKNLRNLIDAFRNVHEKYPDNVQLNILGDGPMFNDLKKYITSLSLDRAVHLMGWVKHDNVAENLHKMDIAIHHSANPYMSPLKIFEYMAVGIAVIGPDIPSVREIFEDEKDLLLVHKTEKDLTEKMLFFMENKEERDRIARTANKKVRENFGWNSNAANIINIMKRKIDENN